jgi:flagellar biosynthesis GTPase FlhF
MPEYKQTIHQMKLDLTDKLHGKKKELDAAETARQNKIAADKAAAEAKNEADKKAAQEAADKAAAEERRLAKEKADREERERIQREEDDKAAKLKAEQDAEATKQVEMAQTLFDNAVETAAVVEEVKAIEGYEIEVVNPAGWLQIAQFWFQNEGIKCSNDEIEKKTFKQMKAFCEKWYKKNGATGLSSPYIKYNEVFKAKTGLK